jgi:hypothetical protein
MSDPPWVKKGSNKTARFSAKPTSQLSDAQEQTLPENATEPIQTGACDTTVADERPGEEGDCMEEAQEDLSAAEQEAQALSQAINALYAGVQKPAGDLTFVQPDWKLNLATPVQHELKALTSNDLMRMVQRAPMAFSHFEASAKTLNVCIEACIKDWRNLAYVPDGIDRAQLCAGVLDRKPGAINNIPQDEITFDLIRLVRAPIKKQLLRRRPFLRAVAGDAGADPIELDRFCDENKFTRPYLVRLRQLSRDPAKIAAIQDDEVDDKLINDLMRVLHKHFLFFPAKHQTWERCKDSFGGWTVRALNQISGQDFWCGLVKSEHFQPSFLRKLPQGLAWRPAQEVQWLKEDPQLLEYLPLTKANILAAASADPTAIRFLPDLVESYTEYIEPFLNETMADELMKMVPVIFLEFPDSYQTWQRCEAHFGDWILDKLKAIKNHDFWLGLAQSERWRRAFLYLAPAGVPWDEETQYEWLRQDPALIEVLPQTTENVRLAVSLAPHSIKHVMRPQLTLIMEAIDRDHRVARNVRLQSLPPEVIEHATRTRLERTRKPNQTLTDDDLCDIYRDELILAHQESYSLWALEHGVFRYASFTGTSATLDGKEVGV